SRLESPAAAPWANRPSSRASSISRQPAGRSLGTGGPSRLLSGTVAASTPPPIARPRLYRGCRHRTSPAPTAARTAEEEPVRDHPTSLAARLPVAGAGRHREHGRAVLLRIPPHAADRDRRQP